MNISIVNHIDQFNQLVKDVYFDYVYIAFGAKKNEKEVYLDDGRVQYDSNAHQQIYPLFMKTKPYDNLLFILIDEISYSDNVEELRDIFDDDPRIQLIYFSMNDYFDCVHGNTWSKYEQCNTNIIQCIYQFLLNKRVLPNRCMIVNFIKFKFMLDQAKSTFLSNLFYNQLKTHAHKYATRYYDWAGYYDNNSLIHKETQKTLLLIDEYEGEELARKEEEKELARKEQEKKSKKTDIPDIDPLSVEIWMNDKIIQLGMNRMMYESIVFKEGNLGDYMTDTVLNWPFYNYKIVNTISDGSCLLHAILIQISPIYRTLSIDDRKKMGIEWRRDLYSFYFAKNLF